MCIKKWFKKETVTPKFGSLAKVGDPRTIQFQQLLSSNNLPPLPSEYMIDAIANKRVPTPMFQNDAHNCCVIAARGHETLVFEDYEQGITIPVQDSEILNEYYKQTGGTDNGLYMLNSVKLWQSQGWIAGGKNYKIYAFAEITKPEMKNHSQICHAIIMCKGLYVGLNMLAFTGNQFQQGNPWTYSAGDSVLYNHCVYIVGYDQIGPICITWGKLQHMTWEYFENCCTECYVIIDNKDDWIDPAKNPLDIEKLQNNLNIVKNIPTGSLSSAKITVLDKYMNPVENCQVGVYIGNAAQTYAYTSVHNPKDVLYINKFGYALFNGLRVGQEYEFTAQFQMPSGQALYPKSVTKTISVTDPTTTTFTIQLPFDYLASKEAGRLIL